MTIIVSWSGVYSNGYEPLGALYSTRHPDIQTPDTRHQPRAHIFSRLVVVRESCIRLYASAKAHHLLFEKAELQSIRWLYSVQNTLSLSECASSAAIYLLCNYKPKSAVFVFPCIQAHSRTRHYRTVQKKPPAF